MENVNITDLNALGIPVVLTIACNLFAEGLKRAAGEGVNRWIPLILMTLSGIAYPMVASISELKINTANPSLYLVLVGICIGGMSVGVNQVIKQFTSKEEKK